VRRYLQYPQGIRLGSETQIRVVDKDASDEANDITSDSGPEVRPVAFMPSHVENREVALLHSN
jgi:hypothetical protein